MWLVHVIDFSFAIFMVSVVTLHDCQSFGKRRWKSYLLFNFSLFLLLRYIIFLILRGVGVQ